MSTHTTKDGQKMFISQMTNEHLLNTAKLIISKSCVCMNRITKPSNTRTLILSNVSPTLITETAQNILSNLQEQLAKYLPEIIIRDQCSEIMTELRELYGRSEMETLSSMPNYVDDEDNCMGLDIQDTY